MDRHAFAAACKALGLHLSHEQIEAFAQFEEHLYQANESMNLTRVPREECWKRHFIDSLLFHDLIRPKSKVLDIGCGPGFPSWPLACARPDLNVTALDSSAKMTSFLRRQTLPNLRVVNERAETMRVTELFGVVTGRAVAPLPIQLELSARPCKIEGWILPMRTPSEEPLLERCGAPTLGLKLISAKLRETPGSDVVRMIPVFEKREATPDRYPRPWPEIKKAPLGGD